ncbi:MAG: hypothetical protein GXP31_02545 [Kiritimatiellaeota bacterium]|nr:hypothetical protein [Kiritimatiellota bacterium]
MNHRERAMAILHYEAYDRLPVVHFGYWNETLLRWAREGHITQEEARTWGDGNPADKAISTKLGFDFNWYNCFHPHTTLRPPIEHKVIREFPDGSKHVQTGDGSIILQMPDAGSIPSEIDHLLKDRCSWEENFKPRLEFCVERVTQARVFTGSAWLSFDGPGLEYLRRGEWDTPLGLFCGSLYGVIRNWLGVVGASYLQVDDEPLFDEIIDTVGNLCFEVTRTVLERGARFDFAHFWEDICFKSGPLIHPEVFRAKVGPHYRRIAELVGKHGIDIVSLDCDGKIDALIPVWLENGVNTMFPIEVGTWRASIAPWRKQYGRRLRGVGGVDKKIFARDAAAVDAEIERLKPLVDQGGFIPCIDHRIAPDAQWDTVRYYCDRMHAVFG